MRVCAILLATLSLLVGEVISSAGNVPAEPDVQCKQEGHEKCSSVLGKCVVKKGIEQCSCPELFVWSEKDKDCLMDPSYLYTVSFKTPNSSKTAEESLEDCKKESAAVESAMRRLYYPDFRSVKLLKCSDEYKVELSFNTIPERDLLDKIRECDHPPGEQACFFRPELYVIEGSVSEVAEENLCDTYLKDIAPKFGKHYECTKLTNQSAYALTCAKSHKAMASYTRGALQVDLCAERKCEEYCTEKERQCLEGKCVCHINYIESSEGVCTPICDKNPCKNRGVCERSEKVSYYCRCPPSYTGPKCGDHFKQYTVAQRNITIVGVVLGVFIIICLGISGAVIRRLKNKSVSNEHL